MEISIFQISAERDTNRVMFLPYKNLERFQHSPGIDCKIYNKVFEGKIDSNSLEDVYRQFNLDIPPNYTGRSLSVSDVVEIGDSDSVEPGFYFCDDIGFRKIDFDKSLCSETDKGQITEKISVLLVQPGEYPQLVEIGSSLEEMQDVVGGYIEEYMPFKDEVAIVCNGEGKINGMPLNRAVYDSQTHEIIDIVTGDFFIAYAPIESEKFLSLPKEMADKYAGIFMNPEKFFRDGNSIKAIPVKPEDFRKK